MLKIIISGCNGRMGQVVTRICEGDSGVKVIAGFDLSAVNLNDFTVYADPFEYDGGADVLIDFSNPAFLDKLLSYCEAQSLPLVLCTTGHSDKQLKKIEDYSSKIPIFKSANMSLGINLLIDLVKKAAKVLGGAYDIEILERHHKTKVDAPSGTALMLADAANEVLPFEAEYVYNRQNVRKERRKNEIGISAVRGGTIVGEHEVIFAGLDEVIEIKHAAYSREVFATGAVTAAKFLAGVNEPGMYNMGDLLADIGE